MSVAKLIGPDIEELIRENPKELAAAVADLHPADLAELLEDLRGRTASSSSRRCRRIRARRSCRS